MKWEYKEQKGYLAEYELNQLGEDGWELITYQSWGSFFDSGCFYIFKRQMKEENE